MTRKLKKSRKSGKSTRLISIKKLQKLCEEAWKAVIRERDGNACKVQEYYPDIEIKHTRTFQADHCISRKNKLLFLDTRNGTMVCSACNQAKGFNNKSIHRAIDKIVADRESTDTWIQLVETDMKKSINPFWNKRWWLEEQLERLNRELQEIKRSREIRNNTDIPRREQLINSCVDIDDSGDCGNDSSESDF